MAERIADGGEPAVDELRRKARRRLVGAIVLALAAAIIVPMLLENEPRPLGDDVSVQIPSKDEGRFVNRLTGTTPDAKPAPRAEGGATGTVSKPLEPAPAASRAGTPRGGGAPSPADPRQAIAEAEQRVLAPAASPITKAAPVRDATEPKREPEPRPAAEAPTATPAPTAAPAPSATPTTPPVPTATTAPVTSPASGAAPASPAEGFVVQLAAFADDKGANALANKLKRANYAAFVEPVSTSRGMLWRVRVGGYASRAEADAARARLKEEGYSGIVAAVK